MVGRLVTYHPSKKCIALGFDSNLYIATSSVENYKALCKKRNISRYSNLKVQQYNTVQYNTVQYNSRLLEISKLTRTAIHKHKQNNENVTKLTDLFCSFVSSVTLYRVKGYEQYVESV